MQYAGAISKSNGATTMECPFNQCYIGSKASLIRSTTATAEELLKENNLLKGLMQELLDELSRSRIDDSTKWMLENYKNKLALNSANEETLSLF